MFTRRRFTQLSAALLPTLGGAPAAWAQAGKDATAEALGKPVATAIEMAPTFWPAEEYHRDYAKRNAADYYAYRAACGRDARLRAVWGR